MKFLPLVLLLSLSSNAIAKRKPSALDPIFSLLEEVRESLKDGVSSHQECHEKASGYYKRFFELSASDVNLEQLSVSELELLMDLSFQSRLKIRSMVKDFDPKAPMAEDCMASARSINRALRYLEDYTVEALEKRNPSTPYVTLSGQGSFFLKNPKHKFDSYKELQSGDVILSRGGAYSSAAIARIGKSDAQFSHLSFVYKDKEGKLHTTEAHIEIGSVVAPMQVHIDQENVREVVFRYKDQALAAKAAKMIYEKVKKHTDSTGKNIQYDFSMDYKDSKRLFCSEIISHGFELASGGKENVPLNRTKFTKGLIPFLNDIGVQVNEDNVNEFDTFAPGDIEFDPRFELIAEWRRPSKLTDTREKDAILMKIYEWMEKERYQFRPSFGMNLKSYSAWVLRRIPLVKKKLEEQFPLNMNTTQLKTFMVVDEVGEALQERLAQAQSQSGEPLSFQKMLQILEEFREVDRQTPRRDSKFHKRFRPSGAGKS